MIAHDGVRVKVHVDGVDIPEYLVEEDLVQKKLTCWIPSQVGKELAILVTNERQEQLAIEIKADGTLARRTFLDCFQIQNVAFYRESSTVLRPFTFAKLDLVDDDDLRDSSGVHLGELELVCFNFVQISKRKNPNFKRAFPENGLKVHERTKKGIGQHIGLGRVVSPQEPCTFTRIKATDHIITFVFRYRPIEYLQAQGIAPLDPPRPFTTPRIDAALDRDSFQLRIQASNQREPKVKVEEAIEEVKFKTLEDDEGHSLIKGLLKAEPEEMKVKILKEEEAPDHHQRLSVLCNTEKFTHSVPGQRKQSQQKRKNRSEDPEPDPGPITDSSKSGRKGTRKRPRVSLRNGAAYEKITKLLPSNKSTQVASTNKQTLDEDEGETEPPNNDFDMWLEPNIDHASVSWSPCTEDEKRPVFYVASDPFPEAWRRDHGILKTEVLKIKKNRPNAILAAFTGGKKNPDKINQISAAILNFTGVKVEPGDIDTLDDTTPWIVVDVKKMATASKLINAGLLYSKEHGFMVTFRRVSTLPVAARNWIVKVSTSKKNKKALDAMNIRATLFQIWKEAEGISVTSFCSGNEFYVETKFPEEMAKSIAVRKYYRVDNYTKYEFRYSDDCDLCHSHSHLMMDCPWVWMDGNQNWAMDFGEGQK